MKTTDSPSVRVGIEISSPEEILLRGDYASETIDGRMRHIPADDYCRAELPAVKIGIGFHWEKEIPFILRGELEVYPADGKWMIVNKLPIENYLESVISSEMNPDAPAEFLRAHAVISRGWLLGKLRHHTPDSSAKLFTEDRIITWEDTSDHQDFDVCADDHCQRYQGEACVNENARQAVLSTRGMVLVDDDGAPADTRFSKCCAGKTERFSSCWQPKDYPYLRPVADPYCSPDYPSKKPMDEILASALKDYDHTDYYRWREQISSSELSDRIRARYGLDLGRIAAISPVSKGDSGRLYEIEIHGSKRNLRVGKELEIRRLLSPSTLRSSLFNTIPQADGFIFEGRGWGHGVGLCQIGAAVMASEGFSAEEILEHYYPGTRLLKLY